MARFWFRSIEMSTGWFLRPRGRGHLYLTSTGRLRAAPPLERTSYHRSAGTPGTMREGPGREEWRLVAAAAGARPRPIGRMRSAAAVALVVLGLGAAAGAFVGLEQATARSVEPLREATAPVDVQRFTFDRTAWRTVAIDDVFPPV